MLDFGIAKSGVDGEEDKPDGKTPRRLTHPGMTMGTPEYMAPEQAAGRPADPRSDVYAAGGLLYEMLSGKPPYEGKNFMEILHKKATTSPAALSTFRDDIPAALAPAGVGLHRIKDNRAVLVETHPVVGKHRIGLDRLGGILHRAYCNAFAFQRPHEPIELPTRRDAGILTVRRLLHFVGQRGFRVVTECRRPNHQHGTGTLLS